MISGSFEIASHGRAEFQRAGTHPSHIFPVMQLTKVKSQFNFGSGLYIVPSNEFSISVNVKSLWTSMMCPVSVALLH